MAEAGPSPSEKAWLSDGMHPSATSARPRHWDSHPQIPAPRGWIGSLAADCLHTDPSSRVKYLQLLPSGLYHPGRLPLIPARSQASAEQLPLAPTAAYRTAQEPAAAWPTREPATPPRPTVRRTRREPGAPLAADAPTPLPALLSLWISKPGDRVRRLPVTCQLPQ